MHNSDCKDGEIRLVGGASDSEGTVEVCLGSLWGLVAESEWSLADAQVVCRQLGLPPDGKTVIYNTNFVAFKRTITLVLKRKFIPSPSTNKIFNILHCRFPFLLVNEGNVLYLLLTMVLES